MLFALSTSVALAASFAQAEPAAPEVRVRGVRLNVLDMRVAVEFYGAKLGFVVRSLVDDQVVPDIIGKASLRTAMSKKFTRPSALRSEIVSSLVAGQTVVTLEVVHWNSSNGPRSTRATAIYLVKDGRIRRAHYFPAD